MTHVKSLRCRECKSEYPIEPLNACEFCFGPLEVEYDYKSIAKAVSKKTIENGPYSMWRYHDFLPVSKEAAVDISKIANLNPSGVICEIMSDDGSMARLPEIIKFANLHGIKVGTVSELIKFRLKTTKIVKLISERPFESEMGSGFSLKIFQNTISGEKHYALVKNISKENKPVMVRMHRLNVTKDIFEEKNIFGSEIKTAFQLIEKSGSGAIVLINSDMSPNILKTFNKRERPDNKLELREYGVGAQILSLLEINKIILLTNSKKRIIALDGFNIEIVDQQKI